MSEWVVDASAAAKWFLNEPYAEPARRLLQPERVLHAPDFFLLEMDNLFCKRIRRGDWTEEDAKEARARLRRIPVKTHAFPDLQDSAYALAVQSGRSIYDCLYLSLAMELRVPFVTADRRLYESLAAGPLARRVLWVEDLA